MANEKDRKKGQMPLISKHTKLSEFAGRETEKNVRNRDPFTAVKKKSKYINQNQQSTKQKQRALVNKPVSKAEFKESIEKPKEKKRYSRKKRIKQYDVNREPNKSLVKGETEARHQKRKKLEKTRNLDSHTKKPSKEVQTHRENQREKVQDPEIETDPNKIQSRLQRAKAIMFNRNPVGVLMDLNQAHKDTGSIADNKYWNAWTSYQGSCDIVGFDDPPGLAAIDPNDFRNQAKRKATQRLAEQAKKHEARKQKQEQRKQEKQRLLTNIRQTKHYQGLNQTKKDELEKFIKSSSRKKLWSNSQEVIDSFENQVKRKPRASTKPPRTPSSKPKQVARETPSKPSSVSPSDLKLLSKKQRYIRMELSDLKDDLRKAENDHGIGSKEATQIEQKIIQLEHELKPISQQLATQPKTIKKPQQSQPPSSSSYVNPFQTYSQPKPKVISSKSLENIYALQHNAKQQLQKNNEYLWRHNIYKIREIEQDNFQTNSKWFENLYSPPNSLNMRDAQQLQYIKKELAILNRERDLILKTGGENTNYFKDTMEKITYREERYNNIIQRSKKK